MTDLNSDITPCKMNDQGKRLARLLNSFNLKNVIKELKLKIKKLTRVTKNISKEINLMIAKDIHKMETSRVHDICLADHKLIYLKMLLQREKS